jgi:hypothetical protein
MIDFDLVREMISKRLENVKKDYEVLPETDWEDGYNCALTYEMEFLKNMLELMEYTNVRKESSEEDHDVGC